ncbi:hypothetical protein CY34DRAFT_15334 [Suillus luteus UH-Slu-Lm8-n1]|uniref:Uncharacterized protein n=1 Tax=Suillus luteus UH-Slu-Lm8-n1 TaxID=930992 RepID=A0A0D0A8I8_9AGAM|nr:hypothetical protein CY34DRAFT_15334 [Suillus luteus UH-Slu-Lm8-n1]
MSWDELLNDGGEPFNLSFPPMHGVHPSLRLKAAILSPTSHGSALKAIFKMIFKTLIPPFPSSVMDQVELRSDPDETQPLLPAQLKTKIFEIGKPSLPVSA